MVKAGCARRWWRTAVALPRVQGDMMMIPAGRQENRALAISLYHLEAEYSGVKVQGALKVGDLEMYVSNTNLRMNREGRRFLGVDHSDSIQQIITEPFP